MTPHKKPQAAVNVAHTLRKGGKTFEQIARDIRRDLGVQVAPSTVQGWITYRARVPVEMGSLLL